MSLDHLAALGPHLLIVLVPKKDGTVCFCIDFRKVNALTLKDQFPLPLISEVLDSLGSAKYFSNLDLASGYWQIRLAEKDIPKTAFVTYSGQYEFTRMPFGLCNAPGTFQRAMQVVLTGLQPQIALAYLDDILIYSSTFENHLKDIKQVLQRFREHNLKIKLKKCHFAQKELHFLGHLITPEGLKPDPDKLRAVDEFKTPKDITNVRQFLGLAGYYRRFIKDFASIARPLFNLLKNDHPFYWDEGCKTAFEVLKLKLQQPPVLKYPDFRKNFVIESDASGIGIGAILRV